jgi:3-deoxy-D-manno-octulosonate 8-phosphate phosphatase (KDO 8-P phosphatase)
MASLSGMHLRSRLQKRLLIPRLRQIRLVVCDVDGVLTDGGLHYDEAGGVVKRFNVRDGLAVRMLQRAGITVAILSGGRSGAIEHRALHLRIDHCLIGIGDKSKGLKKLLGDLNMTRRECAFIGDDLNDIPAKPSASVLVATADAAKGLRSQADWVLMSKGGEGALREVADELLKLNDSTVKRGLLSWTEEND